MHLICNFRKANQDFLEGLTGSGGDHTSDSNYAAWTGDRIMLCNLEYTIEYTQGGITGSTIEMIMTLSYISVPFFIMHLPYVFRLRYGGFARRIFSIQHFVWDIFENGAVRQRQEESWKMKRCHLHKNMQETGSDSTGSYDIF